MTVNSNTLPKPHRTLTVDEVGEMLQMRREQIYNLVRQNEIPHRRIGKRYLRFNLDEIEAWLHGN
jgi:excisionase family DNA binding protein